MLKISYAVIRLILKTHLAGPFLFIIPSIVATLGNFLLPIMIGAKDVAFPKLNLASYYLFLAGAMIAVAAAREVIAKAVRSVDSVRDDVRDVQIFAQEFADSSINFEITWWTGSRPLDIRSSRDKVVAAVKRALDDAGIEIPFPYRTMTFKEPLSLLKGKDAEEDSQADRDVPAE